MQVFDASSIIAGWDTYPIAQFPPMWSWLAEQLAERRFAISQVALDETKNKSLELYDWLRDNSIEVLPVTADDLRESLRLKSLLGIGGAVGFGTGVGENDLIIIAVAKTRGYALISDESKQPLLPQKLPNYKIPAVCRMQTVEVDCCSFVEMITDSRAVFA